MASSVIKNSGGKTKVTLNSTSQSGTVVKYSHDGYIVVFSIKIVKPNSSYTIVNGLPHPEDGDSVVGTTAVGSANMLPVYITANGAIQIRDSSTFTDARYAHGCYLSKNWNS